MHAHYNHQSHASLRDVLGTEEVLTYPAPVRVVCSSKVDREQGSRFSGEIGLPLPGLKSRGSVETKDELEKQSMYSKNCIHVRACVCAHACMGACKFMCILATNHTFSW